MNNALQTWKAIMRVSVGCVVATLIVLAPARGARPRLDGDDVKGVFKNEKVVLRGDTVVISFKLDVPVDHTYRVGIKLRKRNDPGFGWVLKQVQGDIGEGDFGQKACRVNWLFKKELPEGELGEEFWFELTCELADHGIPWWVYAGGGGVVVVAAVLIFGKKGGTTTTTVDNTLPGPPTDWPLQKK